MVRKLTLLLLVVLGIGFYWWWADQSNMWDIVKPYVENKDFLTLKARYTPDDIMNAHRKELLVDDQHSYQEPTLKFYPYVLMEVKYTDQDKKSKEGVVLWGLGDGEMVIDTDTWEKTHGFEDAIMASADKQDFKILNSLAKNNGSMSLDQLVKELHLEAAIIEPWLDQTAQKHLITRSGNSIQLHFQNPKILVKPQTKISQHFVTKPYNHIQKISTKFSKSQIEKVTKAAFGNDFTIRRITDVFLPVYSIEVLNPDGSILTSYWNAINGQRLYLNKWNG